jgi:hypothetical protein
MQRYLYSYRITVGLVLAAFAPAFVVSVPAFIGGRLREGAWAGLMVLTVSSAVTVLFGIPVVLFFNRMRLLGAKWYMLAGLVSGCGLGLYFILPGVIQNGLSDAGGTYVFQGAILVALSVISSMIYWITVRPDRK